MSGTGPSIEALTHHLAECSADFLEPPRTGRKGKIVVKAVVRDLIDDLGDYQGRPLRIDGFSAAKKPNRLRLVLIACWLLHHPAFCGRGKATSEAALVWLRKGLADLADLVDAERFVDDPDRREELARRCLKALKLLPEGETREQAADRLTTLDSVEQARVVAAARAAERRAREVREAMRRKAAAEAAAKVSRE